MRRSGRTTRIIDACVQEFFTTGRTTPIDHYNKTHSAVMRLNKDLVGIIARRLLVEHNVKAGVIKNRNTGILTLYFGVEEPTRDDINNHRCNELCRPVSDGFHFYIRRTE